LEHGGDGAEHDEQLLPRRSEEQLKIDQLQSLQVDPNILEPQRLHRTLNARQKSSNDSQVQSSQSDRRFS
jgi:hypothetical protein